MKKKIAVTTFVAAAGYAAFLVYAFLYATKKE